MAQIVPEKRSPPLNNPLQEQSVAVAAGISYKLILFDNNDRKKERGVSKGEREKGKVTEAIVRCQMCGQEQKIVYGISKTLEWHRCIGCKELQPMDGYYVIAYGRGLPRVLTPNEVKARAAALGY